ncbi:MAG: ATPase, T2SS/T4P/T4SS family [Ilumatobacteraceae bacterium]
MERVIYDVAADTRASLQHRDEVDFELEPGVRFHAGGFRPGAAPYIAIRRAAPLFGASLDELYDRGAADAGIVELARTAVAAGLVILFAGPDGSARRPASSDDLRDRRAAVITTIESDFELNVLQMGKHPYVIAYQERLPTTIDSKGYTPAEAMRPAMRTRADWIIVGEVRGAEGAPLVRAMRKITPGRWAPCMEAMRRMRSTTPSTSSPPTPARPPPTSRRRCTAIDLVVALKAPTSRDAGCPRLSLRRWRTPASGTCSIGSTGR